MIILQVHTRNPSSHLAQCEFRQQKKNDPDKEWWNFFFLTNTENKMLFEHNVATSSGLSVQRVCQSGFDWLAFAVENLFV